MKGTYSKNVRLNDLAKNTNLWYWCVPKELLYQYFLKKYNSWISHFSLLKMYNFRGFTIHGAVSNLPSEFPSEISKRYFRISEPPLSCGGSEKTSTFLLENQVTRIEDFTRYQSVQWLSLILPSHACIYGANDFVVSCTDSTLILRDGGCSQISQKPVRIKDTCPYLADSLGHMLIKTELIANI